MCACPIESSHTAAALTHELSRAAAPHALPTSALTDLRDLDRVHTPKWLQAKRVAPDAPGLAAAPSLMILVRDWSDLSKVKPTEIGDAVMCTDPARGGLEAWIAPFRASGVAERLAALLEDVDPSAMKALSVN